MSRLVGKLLQASIAEGDSVGDDERGLVGGALLEQSKQGRGRHHFQSGTALCCDTCAVPAETSIARLNLAGHALTPGAQRSWWLREALAAEPGSDCPPLARDVNADVVIVGGGFTGLWTAYFLTEANPNLGVVVLEQDICGGGPSGRNGGFASGWWDELDNLVALFGVEAAVRACRAISSSIDSIGDFCAAHRVD